MTMKDLARLAEVSVSTVSKAFSGSKEISEEKRQQIFEIAKRTGCYEKYCRYSFHKIVIAVICPEFKGGYYPPQLAFLGEEIKKRGGEMVVSAYDFDEKSIMDLVSYFIEVAKVDGVLVYGTIESDLKYTVPIVVIGKASNVDCVFLSGKTAVSDSVRYFAENGHRDIAFLGEKLTRTKCRDFEEAMKQNNLDIDSYYIIESDARFEEAGYIGMNKLLMLKKPPTAVLAAYDSIAIGAMKSIYEHGLEVPKDISLIGMDDNRESSYLNTSLTSITSYNEDLCQIAVDMLFDRIKGSSKKVKKVNVSKELIRRNSVGKVQKQ